MLGAILDILGAKNRQEDAQAFSAQQYATRYQTQTEDMKKEIQALKNDINDDAGLYLEKIIPIRFKNKIKKIKIYPAFPREQISGSTGKRYGGIKNIIREIIYIHF